MPLAALPSEPIVNEIRGVPASVPRFGFRRIYVVRLRCARRMIEEPCRCNCRCICDNNLIARVRFCVFCLKIFMRVERAIDAARYIIVYRSYIVRFAWIDEKPRDIDRKMRDK